MKFQNLVSTSAFFGMAFTTSVAIAADAVDKNWPLYGAPPPQQGSMCGSGGAGQCGANGSGAAPLSSGQGGCPMMRNVAALQERVRQLEQRLDAQSLPQAR